LLLAAHNYMNIMLKAISNVNFAKKLLNLSKPMMMI